MAAPARAGENQPRLPLLENIRQVHVLSPAEAGRGYPVHLNRAQVTFDRKDAGTVFLIDSTGGLRAEVEGGKAAELSPGDLVSVDGVTGAGSVTPVIQRARIQKTGHAPLPAPPLVSMDRLFSGDYEADWVSVEGIVKAVASTGEAQGAGKESAATAEVSLLVVSGQSELNVFVPARGNAIPLSLVDAKVRLRAVVCGRFNPRKLLVGIDLYMPNLSFVQVVEPAVADPFSLPVLGVGDVTRIGTRESGHRVHVRGVVTSTWGNRNFSVMDAEHGTYVGTEKPVSVKIGDLLDIVGFPSIGDFTAYIEAAQVRRIGAAPTPPPVRVTVSEALAGAHDAEIVELEGQLVDWSRLDSGAATISLTENRQAFLAVLAPGYPAEMMLGLQRGSRIRVKGICVIHADREHNPREVNVLPQSPSDIVVLTSPSWWSPRHTIIVTVLLFAIVLMVAGWNYVLRRRVRSQTKLIRSQLEESQNLRAEAEASNLERSRAFISLQSMQSELIAAQEKLKYQATHDSLTGLWNRAALLDFLHHEMERAQRTHSSLGILLMDVDHFKNVNDTYGHLAGDVVLREIGTRLMRATRPYDVTGRYGGEEFLVLLPHCNREETELAAERIRDAIGSAQFRAGKAEFVVTLSIGATTAFECTDTYTTLLNQADVALYAAKAAGRNRTVLHEGGQPQESPASLPGTR
jgi:diguanylate cyclase (GGDEF)-like protein